MAFDFDGIFILIIGATVHSILLYQAFPASSTRKESLYWLNSFRTYEDNLTFRLMASLNVVRFNSPNLSGVYYDPVAREGPAFTLRCCFLLLVNLPSPFLSHCFR